MSVSPIFKLSSDLVDEYALLSPVMATMMGVSGSHCGWDDFGPEGTAAVMELWRSAAQRLDQRAPQNADDQLARDVIADHIAWELGHHASQDDLEDLNTIASNLQTAPVVVESMTVGLAEDAEVLGLRLEGVAGCLGGYRARLRAGIDAGRVVAARQVREGIAQCGVHASDASVFATRATQAAQAYPAHAAHLERGAGQARAAYAELAEWLERVYLPHARPEDPVGRDRYRRAANRHLGMAIDLDETYAWGWSEVRRIDVAMQEVAEQIAPGAGVAGAVKALRGDPQWCAATVDGFLAIMAERQHDALSRLHGVHFDVPEPVRRIEVALAPPGGPLGAYYRGPSEDFSRPGTVCYRLEEQSDVGWFDEVSTAYHEGFPGHHLHIATSVHRAQHLSRFQRLAVHNTGHAEGWALYAETLMHELGFLEHPALVLGRLINESVRAWRVVIDIGLHLEKPITDVGIGFHPDELWTPELANEALVERAMVTPGRAWSNVVRYLGWPGQAIAYKVGERVILDARAELRRRGVFDAPRFHEGIVTGGLMGLARLQKRMLDQD